MADQAPGQDPVVPEQTTGNEQEPSQNNNPDPQADPQQTASPREDRRAQNIATKLRDTAEERDSYRRQLEERSNPNPPQRQDPQSVDQLERDMEQTGAQQYQKGRDEVLSEVDQRFFVADLERDKEVLENRFEELDERSDNYRPELVESVNRQYLRAIGFNERTGEISNPKIRYRDFAEDYMGDLQRYGASASADTARNVATQASRTGVRPNSPSRRSGIGQLQPGDISKMDSKDYEKNKDAINAQILGTLGV